MITFEQVTVTYPDASRPTLHDVDLRVEEGELCLVVGPTGAGKSTLLSAVNGLVPHFTGGRVDGRVTVAGRDTRRTLPRDLADVVGFVPQDPVAGFVTDTVEDELAYGMEQIGRSTAVMRTRVEEILDLMGLATVRHRPLADLSGGEQQRVAIGSVLTTGPRVLVLDEPTSALDPAAAEEVLSALTRMVHDLGMTVLLAEHRLERVVQYADSLVVVATDGTVTCGDPQPMMVASPVAPPVVDLGRLVGWDPLPLSVRDARRRSGPLRARIGELRTGDVVDGAPRTPLASAEPLLAGRELHVHHGRTHAVRGVSLDVAPGELVALMGRNGAGKSSLLWTLQGSGPRTAGTVRIPTGVDPATLPPARSRRYVALVPQVPTQLLYLDSVGAECRTSDAQAGAAPGTTRKRLDTLLGVAPGDPGHVPDRTHPRDLSEGGRLALALAVQLAAEPSVLLLDEPTRGLDYAAKRRLVTALREHTAGGGGVVLSSHDVEFVADCADRVVVLADGEVVADAPAAEVLVGSPVFAPQTAKVLYPLPLLSVDQVRAALGPDHS